MKSKTFQLLGHVKHLWPVQIMFWRYIRR